MKKIKTKIKKILIQLRLIKQPNLVENYTFKDQKGQLDFIINNVFNYQKNGLKKRGYFIDLACADGVTINNTFFLEKYLKWDGLLFEPNPHFKEKIMINRTSKLIEKCISDRNDQKIKFRIDNGMLGGIVSESTDNNFKYRSDELKKANIIEINTSTLDKELDRNNAPSLIDYMSLDVEGAEYLVLKNFPFDKYKFRCMSIERPNKQLDILLDLNNYRQVAHLKFDVIYVHQDYLNDINFYPDIKFKFTPKKNW